MPIRRFATIGILACAGLGLAQPLRAQAPVAPVPPAPVSAPAPAPAPAPAAPAPAKAATVVKSAGPAASAAVFPAAPASKYAKEKPGSARMHTCLDQYHANKNANANGGLKWIQKGGGYYSVCLKKMKKA